MRTQGICPCFAGHWDSTVVKKGRSNSITTEITERFACGKRWEVTQIARIAQIMDRMGAILRDCRLILSF